jgi:hypothetical protein
MQEKSYLLELSVPQHMSLALQFSLVFTRSPGQCTELTADTLTKCLCIFPTTKFFCRITGSFKPILKYICLGTRSKYFQCHYKVSHSEWPQNSPPEMMMQSQGHSVYAVRQHMNEEQELFNQRSNYIKDWMTGDRVPTRVEIFSLSGHSDRLWCPPNLLTNDYRNQSRRRVKLTTHFNLIPRLRMRGAYTSTVPYFFNALCVIKYRNDFRFACQWRKGNSTIRRTKVDSCAWPAPLMTIDYVKFIVIKCRGVIQNNQPWQHT